MSVEFLGAKRNITSVKGGSFQDNGAVVVLGGSTSTAVTSVPSTSLLGYHTANYGNTVHVSTQEGTATVSNATGIANQVAGKYSIQVISSSLLGGANQPEQSLLNARTTFETQLSVTTGWSLTGQFLSDPPVQLDNFAGIISGGAAYQPSRAVPSIFRMLTGSKIPTKTNAPALTD